MMIMIIIMIMMMMTMIMIMMTMMMTMLTASLYKTSSIHYYSRVSQHLPHPLLIESSRKNPSLILSTPSPRANPNNPHAIAD